MTDQVKTLYARDHLDPGGSIVLSARLFGGLVARHLASGSVVRVSFADVRGLASSYFNELLHMIVEVLGTTHFSDRVQFDFDSPVQRQVCERSLAALHQSAA